MGFNFLGSTNLNSYPDISPLPGNNNYISDPFYQEEEDVEYFFDNNSPLFPIIEKEKEYK